LSHEQTDYLVKYVLNTNPGLDERMIVAAYAMNDYDVYIEFRDGSKIIFDTYANTSRRVYDLNRPPTEMDLRRELKDNLYAMMERKDINEMELAEKVGTTQPMISRYLQGRSIPNAITLKKIAIALDCSIDDFFYKRFY